MSPLVWSLLIGWVSVQGLPLGWDATFSVDQEYACNQVLTWPLPDHGDILWPIEGASDYERQVADLKIVITKARMNMLVRTVELACRASGRYPQDVAELQRFSDELAESSRCRLETFSYVDGWEHPMYYELRAGRPFLVSAGADGLFSTPDDVKLPEKNDAQASLPDITTECR